MTKYLITLTSVLLMNSGMAQGNQDPCALYQSKFDDLSKSHLDSALSVAYEQHYLGLKNGEIQCLLEGAVNLLTYYSFVNSIDSIQYYYSLVQQNGQTKDSEQLVQKSNLVVSAYYINAGLQDSSINILKPMLEKEDLSPDYYVKGSTDLAIAYSNNFNQKLCVATLLKADSVAQLNSIKTQHLIDLYGLFGLTYQNSGNFHQSITYYTRAINASRTAEAYRMLPYYYGNITMAHIELNEESPAKSNIDSALQYLEYSPLSEGLVQWALGSYYQIVESHQEAINSFEKTISFCRKRNVSTCDFYRHNATISLLFSKAKMGHTQGYSKYLTELSEDILAKMNTRDSLFIEMYNLIESVDNINHESSQRLVDNFLRISLYFKEVKESAIADILEKYETEKKELENQVLLSENSAKQATIRQQRAYLGGSLIGVLGLVYGLYFLRQRNRKEKELYRKSVGELQSDNEIWRKKVQKARNQKKKVIIQEGDQIFLKEYKTSIPINDILYVQSDGNYVRIFTHSKPTGYHIRNTLNRISTEYLPDIPFARINLRTIINMNYILVKKSQKVVMAFDNGEVLFGVGRAYKKNFSALYELMPESDL